MAATIETVHQRWGALKYMRLDRAQWLRNLFLRHQIRDVLELGFFHGKSAAFMAAILEEQGGHGHVTTMDRASARQRDPNIETVLNDLGLAHRVTPLYCETSFNWDMHKLLDQAQFDFVYIDGAHTWEGTSLAFFFVDLMLRPGGWLLFDDMNWSVAGSPTVSEMPAYLHWPAEEREAPSVRMVFEKLVPRRGYINCREVKQFGWGLAQKPPAD